ncbi:hypothetical protein GCM10027047_16900 [Rhodococcus aerolatus]
MTTTDLPRNGVTQSSAVPPLPSVSTARRQRRRGLLALALALVVLFAVGTVAAFDYFSATHSAVGVGRTVPYGQQVTSGDLVEVSIPNGDTLNSIDWAARDSLVGGFASTTLQAGQLLPGGVVVASLTPPPGSALVAVGVKVGFLPATELAAGDQVRVVAVQTATSATGAAAGSSSSIPTGQAVQASVFSIGGTDASGSTVVDVVVADRDANAVAQLSALGAAAIVLTPKG